MSFTRHTQQDVIVELMNRMEGGLGLPKPALDRDGNPTGEEIRYGDPVAKPDGTEWALLIPLEFQDLFFAIRSSAASSDDAMSQALASLPDPYPLDESWEPPPPPLPPELWVIGTEALMKALQQYVDTTLGYPRYYYDDFGNVVPEATTPTYNEPKRHPTEPDRFAYPADSESGPVLNIWQGQIKTKPEAQRTETEKGIVALVPVELDDSWWQPVGEPPPEEPTSPGAP